MNPKPVWLIWCNGPGENDEEQMMPCLAKINKMRLFAKCMHVSHDAWLGILDRGRVFEVCHMNDSST